MIAQSVPQRGQIPHESWAPWSLRTDTDNLPSGGGTLRRRERREAIGERSAATAGTRDIGYPLLSS